MNKGKDGEFLVSDIFLVIAAELDTVTAVMFALTCKREWKRYVRRKGPGAETYRSLYLLYVDDERVYWGNKGEDLLPGDKGYEQAKKKHDKFMNEIIRNESRYERRREKERREKDRRFVAKQWKKGVYDIQ